MLPALSSNKLLASDRPELREKASPIRPLTRPRAVGRSCGKTREGAHALARRLNEDGRTDVLLLLEADGSDRHPYVCAPAGFIGILENPRFNWCCTTDRMPGADDPKIVFPP